MLTPEEILKKNWGYSSFRPLQREIVQSALDRRDTLALLPTGGGKSICFQVPALMLGGVCLVITPLIALMKDQVEQLKKREIRAAALYAGLSPTEIDYTLDRCIYGDLQFLYISPERLLTDLLRVRAKQMKIGLVAVDEAHCISQWGHDFRPPYLRIHEFRAEVCPDTPILAVTATATDAVREDIIEHLKLQNPQIFVQSFARPNLVYAAAEVANKERKLLDILQKTQGSGIVYARTRKRTVEVAQFLQKQGHSAEFYHAGLPTQERFARQQRWINNQTRWMVATNAFGMGIDKPDVRVVVHMDFPDSLENYYQESGRAGRDEKTAYGICLYQPQDIEQARRQIEQKYPDVATLRHLYQCLSNYFKLALGSEPFAPFDFDLGEFCSIYGLTPHTTHFALKLLEEFGFITLSDAYYSPSKLSFLMSTSELYDLQLRSANMEKFTKCLLRLYGGELMGNYVRISENAIAQAFYLDAPEVEKWLERLHESGLVDYQKQKFKPQLTFLTARQDADRLPIDSQWIQQRKEKESNTLESVVSYLTDDHACRMQYIQHYFDEPQAPICGKCDRCRQRASTGDRAAHYRTKLLEVLPCTVDELVQSPFFTDKGLLRQVLDTMMAEDVVYFSKLGFLQTRSPR